MTLSAKARARSTPGGAVLAKALLAAGAALGLSRRELAAIVGVSPATMTRIGRGETALEPDTKPGELALLVVRAFRSLDALVGGDDAAARAWLAAPNDHLGGTPRELVLTAQGLVHVVEYLDAVRGRL